MKRLIWVFGLLLVFTAMAFAGSVETPATKISSVVGGFEKEYIYFTVQDEILNPANCKDVSTYAVDPKGADARAFLAMLLVAQATNRAVRVLVADDDCYKSRPVALGLTLQGE